MGGIYGTASPSSVPTYPKFGIDPLRNQRLTRREIFFPAIPFLLIYRKWNWLDLNINADFLAESHKLQQQEESQDNGAAISRTIHSYYINLVTPHQACSHKFKAL